MSEVGKQRKTKKGHERYDVYISGVWRWSLGVNKEMEKTQESGSIVAVTKMATRDGQITSLEGTNGQVTMTTMINYVAKLWWEDLGVDMIAADSATAPKNATSISSY